LEIHPRGICGREPSDNECCCDSRLCKDAPTNWLNAGPALPG
jgi:hypothetical protein